MRNNIEKFKTKNMVEFRTLAAIARQKKHLEAQEKQIKEVLFYGMERHGITSIDNDMVKINYIPESESVSLDTKSFLNAEPDLYHELEKKYNKRKKTKAYIRITDK